jgi:hypothetical protein
MSTVSAVMVLQLTSASSVSKTPRGKTAFVPAARTGRVIAVLSMSDPVMPNVTDVSALLRETASPVSRILP